MCFGTGWGRHYRIGKRRVVADQQLIGVALRSEDHKHGRRKLLSLTQHIVLLPRSGHVLDQRWATSIRDQRRI
jgi:hypothetical protein